VKKKYTASSKDKKDWETFISQIDRVETKEVDLFSNSREINTLKKLDLHGYSLNDANHKVKKFLIQSFEKGYRKILLVTGKGSRSKVSTNPYISEKFGVLKNSVPEFIKNDENLNKIVIKITTADKNHGGNGALYIFLKNKKKL